MLFGEFWHQGELCILFADTNAGKSVLAVQIGESIARATKHRPLCLPTPSPQTCCISISSSAPPSLTSATARPDGDHQFSDNFYRAQFNPDTPTTPPNFNS